MNFYKLKINFKMLYFFLIKFFNFVLGLAD